MTWRIDGRPGEFFPNEGTAIAKAWEYTPPGKDRPKVHEIADSQPIPFSAPIETRTYTATKIMAKVTLTDSAVRTSSAAVEAALVRRLEDEAFRKNLVFDQSQVELHTSMSPATSTWDLIAEVPAWDKEAVEAAGEIPAAGSREIVVPVRSNSIAFLAEGRAGWSILGHTTEGFTFNTTTELL